MSARAEADDAIIRPVAVTMTALAVLAVVLDAPAAARVPTVLVFALLAPGLALTRFVPDVDPLERLACALAASSSMVIVASLALVAAGRWAGEPVLAALTLTTLAAALVPRPRLVGRRRRAEQARNRRLLEQRRRQNEAYRLVRSPEPDQRRMGLLSLSFLLDDDGRAAEARVLRNLARSPEPVALAIGADGLATEGPTVRDAYLRAGSDDPGTRSRGLFELATVLDRTGRTDEAAALRNLASSPDLGVEAEHPHRD